MSLEKILKDIRKRGKVEVEELKKEAKEEAERTLKEARDKRRKIIEGSLAEALKVADRLKAQEVSRVELENKRARLMMEKELLDEVIERTKARIRDLPADKGKELMRKLISKHRSEGTVIFSTAEHEPMVRTAAIGMTYGGNVDCLGGIIVESSDGNIRYDYRYDTILEAAADATMKEVSRTLFED